MTAEELLKEEGQELATKEEGTTAVAATTAAPPDEQQQTNNDDEKKNDDALLNEADRNLRSTERARIYKFVLTGGPCGGKTTALARVFSYLRERGFEVITCPEAYSVLSSNGMSAEFYTTQGIGYHIQSTVMDVQIALENGVERVLRARGKPGIVLCDRGTMDGAVYTSEEDFKRMLDERNTDVVTMRDNRYDAVFHLVTAADGAANYYTLENNKVRTETAEEAKKLDKRTQGCWVGHPHLYVIDNSTDFEGKMSRLVDVMSKVVGLPSNLKRRSAKFLLKEKPDFAAFPPDIDYKIFEVEKVYLKQTDKHNRDDYSFIRRRTNVESDGKLLGSVYQLTTVQRAGEEQIEQKRIITRREYVTALMSRDRRRHVIRQRRISFLYKLQSFNVHVYEQPAAGLCVLHAQVEAASSENGDTNGDPTVELPPFLRVERRLTNTAQDEEKYGAYSLSLIDKDDANSNDGCGRGDIPSDIDASNKDPFSASEPNLRL